MKKLVMSAIVFSSVCCAQEPQPAVPVVNQNLKIRAMFAPPVVNAPFQAEGQTETVQQLADGTVIHNQQTSEIARDSKGRTRTEESIHKLGPWTTENGDTKIIFLNDPVAGVSYTLFPDTKKADRIPIPPPPSANGSGGQVFLSPKVLTAHQGADPYRDTKPGPVIGDNNLGAVIMMHEGGAGGYGVSVAGTGPASADKSTTEDLGTKTIESVTAQGKRLTEIIPANTIGNDRDIRIVNETWYAPSLHMVVQERRSDPRFGETTFSLTDIVLGEPAPDLFQVPSDYTIASEPKTTISISH